MKSLYEREKKFIAQRCRRTVFWRRLYSSARYHTWKLALLFLGLCVLGWALTLVVVPTPGSSSYPVLITIYDYAVKVAVLLIAALLALSMLTAAPKKSREWEAALAQIKFTNKFGFSPVLVSRQRLSNTNIEEIVFYSSGVSMERWVERQAEVQDALNLTYVESPQYKYNKRYYIALTVSPGIGIRNNETLYDDAL